MASGWRRSFAALRISLPNDRVTEHALARGGRVVETQTTAAATSLENGRENKLL